eukprot:CAMPEP_0182868608 /NCGR_PEP_ID=MMETSP0034_2-20130328/9427_1 /TAXON_ID=156128 /ORGANISM="Nephroselmis pyriformis, Strain CCMP717" /LENGTH=133 /DNA_ID=CAMNT_0025001025 /DNA_START=203 /DNA_END=601 /DNA_ORIENTATION=-
MGPPRTEDEVARALRGGKLPFWSAPSQASQREAPAPRSTGVPEEPKEGNTRPAASPPSGFHRVRCETLRRRRRNAEIRAAAMRGVGGAGTFLGIYSAVRLVNWATNGLHRASQEAWTPRRSAGEEVSLAGDAD